MKLCASVWAAICLGMCADMCVRMGVDGVGAASGDLVARRLHALEHALDLRGDRRIESELSARLGSYLPLGQ